MDSFSKIGTLSDLNPHGQFSKWVDGHDILVFKYKNQIQALSNICPHFGGPVGYHKLLDGSFTCLWHNFQYSAKNGSCVYPDNMKGMKLRAYKIKVENEAIFVQLVEDPTPIASTSSNPAQEDQA
jgi:nitrite reductase (NADH) small subunit